MIINKKAWQIRLHFDKLNVTHRDYEGKAIISATAIKGGVRHFFERAQVSKDYIDSTFGFLEKDKALRGNLRISDLFQEGECQIDQACGVQISPSTGTEKPNSLIKEEILNDIYFSGQIYLENGGVYPSVMTHQLFSAALNDIRLGRDVSRGLGKVKSSKMFRNDQFYEDLLIDPIENILRECGDKLIWQIANEAKCLDKIEWRDLERIMAQVFEEIGFKVILTDGSKDGGKDIILFCLSSDRIDGVFGVKKYYIELKHWRSGKAVSEKPIQKLLEISAKEEATAAALFSTSGFASQISQKGIDTKIMKLQDIVAIRKLCQFYIVSKIGDFKTTKTLEEIFNMDLSEES
jgi:CRISPR/Cas system CSM-associated protein Csm3 (group 7 of RAMP superfamily)